MLTNRINKRKGKNTSTALSTADVDRHGADDRGTKIADTDRWSRHKTKRAT